MMFSVEYDEEFKSKMSEDVVTTITVGDNSLEIPGSETRKGVFGRSWRGDHFCDGYFKGYN